MVTKNAAQDEGLTDQGEEIISEAIRVQCWGARTGIARGSWSGMGWAGRTGSYGALMKVASQKAEIPHEVHYWSLRGTGYLCIIMTCIKEKLHCGD